MGLNLMPLFMMAGVLGAHASCSTCTVHEHEHLLSADGGTNFYLGKTESAQDCCQGCINDGRAANKFRFTDNTDKSPDWRLRCYCHNGGTTTRSDVSSMSWGELPRCTPNSATSQWIYLRTLAGEQSTTIRHGTTKTNTQQKTSQWSADVSETVEAGLKLFGNGVTSTTTAEIGTQQSKSYSSVWSTNEETDFTITFGTTYEGQALWQWQFVVQDGCSEIYPKTDEYAITAGRYQPPRCLPGYKTDRISYQECIDKEHTLPGFDSAVEVV